jgi:predicted kinase
MGKRAILIVGLPGSGKTFLGKRFESKGFYLVDDPKDLNFLQHAKDKIVITDPHLCSVKNRSFAIDTLKNLGYHVKVLYFENQPDKCKKLIKHRNDGRVVNGFESFNYVIPEGVKVMCIFEI